MKRTIIITIWLGVMAVCFYLLWTNPADAKFVPECERWAYYEGEDNYPDSIIMHTIGCDNDGTVGGDYERMEGECAYHARRGYRNGLAANSVELRNYVAKFGCVQWEDGSYSKE